MLNPEGNVLELFERAQDAKLVRLQRGVRRFHGNKVFFTRIKIALNIIPFLNEYELFLSTMYDVFLVSKTFTVLVASVFQSVGRSVYTVRCKPFDFSQNIYRFLLNLMNTVRCLIKQ